MKVSPTPAIAEELVGGSNYVIYSAGDYKTDPTPENWRTQLKVVIRDFHLNPQLVQEQISKMYLNGQRRIALMYHYAEMDAEVHKVQPMHVDRVADGKVEAQTIQNIKDLVQVISETGYEEIFFRFGPQESYSPRIGKSGTLLHSRRTLRFWTKLELR